MAEMIKTWIDGAALVLMGLAMIGAAVNAKHHPLSRTITALVVYALIAVAIASCATSRDKPQPASSAERCVELVEQSCALVAECYQIPIDLCLAERSQCAGVEGITQNEADLCSKALSKTKCGDHVPPECQGIAEPPTRPAPQPETRTL